MVSERKVTVTVQRSVAVETSALVFASIKHVSDCPWRFLLGARLTRTPG